ILQVAAALLLGGCASSQTAQPPAAHQAQPATQATTPINPGTNWPRRAAPQTPGPHAFTDSSGRLKPEIQEYAQNVAGKRNLPLAHVQALLQDARYDAKAAQLMSPAKTRVRRSWVTYRKRFVEPVRMREGLE